MLECKQFKMIWKDILDRLGLNSTPKGWNDDSMWLIKETWKKGWKRQLLKNGMYGNNLRSVEK